MKKVLFAVLVTCFAVVGLSLSTPSVAQNSNSEIGFNVPRALFLQNSKATIEYSIPNFISGTLDLKHFEKIYRLVPDEIAVKCTHAYYEVSNRSERQFTYGGVKVKHTDTTWEFYYAGVSIIVRNATSKELDYLFGEIG